MNRHTHNFGEQWPFDAPDNTAAISCKHVVEESKPILHVSHDEDDGGWQFLCGDAHEVEDARIVCLGCMVIGDRSLIGLSDLPLGWCADRDTAGGPWVRAANPA